MARIFISYRRSSDPHVTGRLSDELARHFDVEDIFRDCDSIKPGEHWESKLKNSLDAAKVCLIVIGPEWLNATDEDGQKRLFQSNDWVRSEIECALSKAKTNDLEIIPVLVKGATLPKSDSLPQTVTGILDFQAMTLSGNNWSANCQQLINSIQDVTGLTKCRRRMTSALAILGIGAIYGIVSAIFELNTGGPITIDTHLGYVTMFFAGALVVKGMSLLAEPKRQRFSIIAILYFIMAFLGISSIVIAFLIWQGEYTSLLLDSMIGLTMLIAGGMFVFDARRLVI